jgi:hypothetical protein
MSCHVSDIHPSLIYCQTKKIEILSPLNFNRDFRLKANSMKIEFAFSLFSVSTDWTSISTQETRFPRAVLKPPRHLCA